MLARRRKAQKRKENPYTRSLWPDINHKILVGCVQFQMTNNSPVIINANDPGTMRYGGAGNTNRALGYLTLAAHYKYILVERTELEIVGKNLAQPRSELNMTAFISGPEFDPIRFGEGQGNAMMSAMNIGTFAGDVKANGGQTRRWNINVREYFDQNNKTSEEYAVVSNTPPKYLIRWSWMQQSLATDIGQPVRWTILVKYFTRAWGRLPQLTA